MPKGRYPRDYFHTPAMDKPLSAIYDDIDAYTGEFFPDEPYLHQWVNATIVVPPLHYQGRFVKGLLMSQGVDLLVQCFPDIKELFWLMGQSMWSSYAWADHADVIMTCYDNPAHLAHYKATHPDRASRGYLPLLDTDYTNEYVCYPKHPETKDIDVLCVARLHDLKNLPNVARALKVYEKKYHQQLKAVFVIGKDFDLNHEGLDSHERDQLRQIEQTLIHVSDYIHFVPRAEYFTELQGIYDRSKCFTLASLIEGKNRGIREAQLHNVPVLAYNAHNQWARGNDVVFPNQCGILVDYDDEAMADGWRLLFEHSHDWAVRQNTLDWMSRKQFANVCLSQLDYYFNTLPEQMTASTPADTLWLDCAMVDNYELSYHDFLYDKQPGLSNLQGLESIQQTFNFYLQRYSLPTVGQLPVFTD
jgi:glycosyltransferase involved in cell wall biosynthesis